MKAACAAVRWLCVVDGVRDRKGQDIGGAGIHRFLKWLMRGRA